MRFHSLLAVTLCICLAGCQTNSNPAPQTSQNGSRFFVQPTEATSVVGSDKMTADQSELNESKLGQPIADNSHPVTQKKCEDIKSVEKAANNENAEMQELLGSCYYLGSGVQKNMIEARHWWKLAAEQDRVQAQFNLGVCYRDGLGGSVNTAQATEWFEKAAKQGHSDAQFNLAQLYMFDTQGSRNPQKALKWYEKAAESGNSIAQLNLANMYMRGDGVKRNDVKAFSLFKNAAENNQPVAQYNLAFMYQLGIGINQNFNEAAYWYQKSANQGYAPAQHRLAILYISGNGVTQELQTGKKWLKKAAAQGNGDAKLLLAKVVAAEQPIPTPSKEKSGTQTAKKAASNVCGDMNDFFFVNNRPVKKCRYESGRTLIAKQVTSIGILASLYGAPAGYDKFIFIFKGNGSDNDLADGDIIDSGTFEYMGPYSYQSLLGQRTVHSFRRLK